MLQSFAQPQDWLYSEPLLFDEEFGESLINDLQLLPTPPQSPPMKAGLASKPLSAEDQLSYVTDILLEDADMLNWSKDFFPEDKAEKESGEDGLWKFFAGDKNLDEKLLCSVLGSSPLLSEIDTRIFDEIAGSILDCHAACEESPEPSESTSDYGSAGGELYSSSDSEEEIDVVTVGRRSSSPAPLPLSELSTRQQRRREEEEQREQKRHHLDIHLQHNYAAPCPPSPLPTSSKRLRGCDSLPRLLHSSRSSSSSSSTSRPHHHSSCHSGEAEDEEERRRTHNVMERQRRNELKSCFVRLRDNVPELSRNDKASKVVILRKARDSIRSLEVEGRRLQARRDKLRDRQEHLKALLQQSHS